VVLEECLHSSGLDVVLEECLHISGLDVVLEECRCLRSGHRVRVKSLFRRSERSAEKECLYVFGLDEVREEYLHIFSLGLVQKTNVAVYLGTQL
jgi:hypothetical protein